MADEKQCRICLDMANEQDMIAPCNCRGSAKYVHRSCLDSWRATDPTGEAFTTCSVCKYTYRVRLEGTSESEEQWRRFRYYSFVFRDIFCAVLIIQAIIFALAFFTKACDSDSRALRNLFPDSWADLGVYYLCGLILFLAVVGLIGTCAYCMGSFNDPSPTMYHDPCFCYCYTCPGHHDCDCNCAGGGGNDKDCAAVMLVIVVILAVVGIFISIALGIAYVNRVLARHMHILWMKEAAKKWVIVDLEKEPAGSHSASELMAAEQQLHMQQQDTASLLTTPSSSSESRLDISNETFSQLQAPRPSQSYQDPDLVKPSAPSLIV
eukprot:TRINITY_DN886_c0_g1_i1.p1 TRINITY_DN886_c0_g1~~TRINITY_DN886_c0_g1_i1.p1  ORF type:complete len:322 (-),score=42.39 TRINITY_DN886_c0_g1_i1:258-1223(-)